MRRITGYLTNKIGKTDRKQTQKNLIEYYFIGKFKRALRLRNNFLYEYPHFAKLPVGAYRIRPKAST